MRLLLTALPLRGHVHPMVPLGLACERAGHDVRFSIPGRYAGRVPLPLRDLPDGGDAPPRDGRPRDYLTFGTVAAGVDGLAAEARADLARLDVDVVDATRGFVDQAAVLADCDVVVHHGGTGTMLGAVEHGRPQVVLPQGADRHLNARRLAELGAAVVDPPSVGDAVRRLLRPDAPERRAVEALWDDLLALPAPADVVPALEAIAADPGN